MGVALNATPTFLLGLRNVTYAIALSFRRDYTENSSESTLKNTERSKMLG